MGSPENIVLHFHLLSLTQSPHPTSFPFPKTMPFKDMHDAFANSPEMNFDSTLVPDEMMELPGSSFFHSSQQQLQFAQQQTAMQASQWQQQQQQHQYQPDPLLDTFDELPPTSLSSYLNDNNNNINSFSNFRNEPNSAAATMDATLVSSNSSQNSSSPGSKKRLLDNNDVSEEQKELEKKEKNRDHAKKTRLRKKQFIKQIQDRVVELEELVKVERLNKKIVDDIDLERRNVRLEVVKQFFNLRGSSTTDERIWELILDPDFTLELPLTLYKSQKWGTKSEVSKRTAFGINDTISDSLSTRVMVEGIGCYTEKWKALKRSLFLSRGRLTQNSNSNSFSKIFNSSKKDAVSVISSLTSGDSDDSRSGSPADLQQCIINKKSPRQPQQQMHHYGAPPIPDELPLNKKDQKIIAALRKERLSYAPQSVIPVFIGVGKTAVGSSPKPKQKQTEKIHSLTHANFTSHELFRGMEPSQLPLDARVNARFVSSKDDYMLAGDTIMGNWTFATTNAVACGAKHECSFDGMVRGTFSEQNKLKRMELSFDTMSVIQQLQRAGSLNIAPNNLTQAMAKKTNNTNSDNKIIVDSGSGHITFVTPQCAKLRGSEFVVEAKLTEVLKGREDDFFVTSCVSSKTNLEVMMEAVSKGRPASTFACLVGQGEGEGEGEGKETYVYIRAFPLADDSKRGEGTENAPFSLLVFEQLPKNA